MQVSSRKYIRRRPSVPMLTSYAFRPKRPAPSTAQKANHAPTYTARPRRCTAAAEEIVLRVVGAVYDE